MMPAMNPPPVVRTTLADRLTWAMKSAEVTSGDLEKAAGVTRQSVYAWRTGRIAEIASKHLLKVAAALHISPHWLQTGEGDPSPELNKGPAVTGLVEVIEAWKWLLPDQREVILAQLVQLADVNRRAAESFGDQAKTREKAHPEAKKVLSDIAKKVKGQE